MPNKHITAYDKYREIIEDFLRGVNTKYNSRRMCTARELMEDTCSKIDNRTLPDDPMLIFAVIRATLANFEHAKEKFTPKK